MAEPVPERPVGSIGWFSVVMLIGHLGLLGIGASSLWVIAGGGWVSWIAAIALVIGYLLLWRLRLAPAARNRFAYRERLLVHLILGPAVIVLGSLANLWLPALAALSVIVLCDALAQRPKP